MLGFLVGLIHICEWDIGSTQNILKFISSENWDDVLVNEVYFVAGFILQPQLN